MSHHTPKTSIMMIENQRNADVENLMLPSSPNTPKKLLSEYPRVTGNSFLGFKLSNLVLTVAIGIIIIIEIKIMYETTKTYNESLVNQLSEKNEVLERSLLNLTATQNDRNELLQKLLKLYEDMKNEAENRTSELEDKIEETKELVVQLVKENKLMYATGEKNFMETLKLVREALTMNTNTVIRLLDENNAIQTKIHNLEESINSHKASDWVTNSGRSKVTQWKLVSVAEFVIFFIFFISP